MNDEGRADGGTLSMRVTINPVENMSAWGWGLSIFASEGV